MSTLKYFSCIFLFSLQSIFSQDYYPLQIGNRWDYFVHLDAGSMGQYYDTLSIEIISKETLSNGLEYFVSSEPIPFWYSYFPTYIREENNKIYVFDIEDSVDCFAFRFDLPEDSFYFNCIGFLTYINSIDTLSTFGFVDIRQTQYQIDFSKKFGVYYHYSDAFFFIEYTLMGCIIADTIYGQFLVDVKNDEPFLNTLWLSQNYPNPFNPSTKIKFEIPDQVRNDNRLVTLKVYDILGNEIATLVNEEKQPGTYEVEFNTSSIKHHPPSGIYFYQLKAGNFVETKKMILLK